MKDLNRRKRFSMFNCYYIPASQLIVRMNNRVILQPNVDYSGILVDKYGYLRKVIWLWLDIHGLNEQIDATSLAEYLESDYVSVQFREPLNFKNYDSRNSRTYIIRYYKSSDEIGYILTT